MCVCVCVYFCFVFRFLYLERTAHINKHEHQSSMCVCERNKLLPTTIDYEYGIDIVLHTSRAIDYEWYRYSHVVINLIDGNFAHMN